VSPRRPIGVLFVCHANHCRSPMAEAVFTRLARARGVADAFEIDSAGTYAREGVAPHPSTIAVTAAHGLAAAGHSRGLVPDDLQRFDHVLAMDRHNLAAIAGYVRVSSFGPLAEPARAQLRLLRQVLTPAARGAELDVPDPIGEGLAGFEQVHALIERCCVALLNELCAGSAVREPLDGER